MWETRDSRKLEAQDNLKKVLAKLGIKSAEPPDLQEILDNMMKSVLTNYGQPDEIFMPGSALKAFLDAVEKDKK